MVPVRDLSWQLFALTGSVDAYLLFKDVERLLSVRHGEESPAADGEAKDAGEEAVH